MENIKFRAWQKDKKMMCEVKNIHFESRQVSLKEKENVTNTRPFEDIELMQFTGLYDNNKKEIYEGDIVKYPSYYDGDIEVPEGIAPILWNKEEAKFYLANNYETCLFDLAKNLKCEVIGNIYENYELLGKKERKVIFLDIDGVLNNEEHLLKLVDMLGEEQYLQLLKDIQELPFNYSSCMLLHGLLNKTGAEIILSSTWRLSSKHIESLEKYTGLKIKDKTPNLQTIRGKEIQQYLDEHKEITEYVILDDDSDMLPEQKGHFVKVDAKKGLTMRNIIDCEKKLKYGDCKWEE